MKRKLNRKEFVWKSALVGAGLVLANRPASAYVGDNSIEGKAVGMIGLDTSHCIALTKMLNDNKVGNKYLGYKVVAAYPTAGSSDLPSSINRLAGYTEDVRQQGVKIVGSIEELLKQVDVILLETIDGRKHLEQVLPVLKAGKRIFIDKPISASLGDTIAIFKAAEQYKVPIFSSSSLRFMEGIQKVAKGSIGKVLGADAYSPAIIEKTHPDLFWYGIHGVEILYTVMGNGCRNVFRVHTEGTDIVVGTWNDGRVGTFRGTRTGEHHYGGTVFGEEGEACLERFGGYGSLLDEIVTFFDTGRSPVTAEETIEICAFMEAADESKLKGGVSIDIETIMQRAKNKQ